MGMIFCHERMKNSLIQFSSLPIFNIHRCSGNKPIFKQIINKKIVELLIILISENFEKTISKKEIKIIDLTVWITKYKINFSVEFCIKFEKIKIKQIVIISITSHIIIIDFEEQAINGEIKRIPIKIGWEKILIYKKI